jgi:bacterioferritin
MTNATKTMENLQKAIAMELGAMHQYQLHAHVLADWGMDKLAEKMREEVQEEMTHADSFIARLIFLGGAPTLSLETPIQPAETLKGLFEADLRDEKDAIDFYTQAARQAEEDRDIGSKKLFEDIVLDEEGHMDWLDNQLKLIARMGEGLYIAHHLADAGATGGGAA